MPLAPLRAKHTALVSVFTERSRRLWAVALEALGHHVSHTVVAGLLHALGYTIQPTSRR